MTMHLLKTRGITFAISHDQSNAPVGQAMVDVKVAKWYIPVLAIKGLKTSKIPVRYWPLFFVKYYFGRREV